MQKNLGAGLVGLALVAMALPAHAVITGFNGPWAAFDNSGALINGFSTFSAGQGTVTGSISPDRTTMTVEFLYPGPHDASIFFENYVNLLPLGPVSYDWTFTTYQTGFALLETMEGTELATFSGPNTWVGSVSVNYSGSYFTYGNINLGSSGNSGDRATLVLTNFVGPGDPIPAPAAILLMPLALVPLARARRHSAG